MINFGGESHSLGHCARVSEAPLRRSGRLSWSVQSKSSQDQIGLMGDKAVLAKQKKYKTLRNGVLQVIQLTTYAKRPVTARAPEGLLSCSLGHVYINHVNEQIPFRPYYLRLDCISAALPWWEACSGVYTVSVRRGRKIEETIHVCSVRRETERDANNTSGREANKFYQLIEIFCRGVI